MKGVLLNIIFIFFSVISIHAQNEEVMEENRLDSLKHAIIEAPLDTTKLRLLQDFCYEHYNADTVCKYAYVQLDLARELKYSLYEARALTVLYWCYYHFNDLVKANTYAYRAIVIADSISELSLVARNYSNLGVSFSKMQDPNKANEFFHKALEIYTLRHDSEKMSETLCDIAYNHTLHRMFKEAEECYGKALEIDIARNDTSSISEDRLGLASAYLAEFELNSIADNDITILEKSKREYNAAYDLAQKTDNSYTLFIFYTEMPNVLMTEIENVKLSPRRTEELLDSCQQFINQAYHIADRDGYDTDRVLIDIAYISYLTHSGQYAKTESTLDSLKGIFDRDKERYKEHYHKLYNAYYTLYKKKGDLKKALPYYEKYHIEYLKSQNQDYAITATENMAKAQFDEEMRVQKEQALMLETRSRVQKVVIFAALLCLVLMLILVLIVIYNFNRSRKINEILDQKNTEITDSINYASLIQRAAMPSKRLMDGIFGDHMVIFRPLNIISGDFFWVSEKGNLKAFAVADCTGHGVPGAFLSMLGMAILENISQRFNDVEVSAGAMLDDMRRVFKQSLHQNGLESDNHDGIDIALVIIDTNNRQIHYAGAFRPLFVVSDGELTKYDADRMPIGSYLNEKEHFTDHVIDVISGDVLYLFSDGITDQFGYDEKHKVHKYTAKRLKNLLTSVSGLPLSEQKRLIANAMDSWRTDSQSDEDEPVLYEQTDDTTLVGIRID